MIHAPVKSVAASAMSVARRLSLSFDDAFMATSVGFGWPTSRGSLALWSVKWWPGVFLMVAGLFPFAKLATHVGNVVESEERYLADLRRRQ